MAESKIFEGIYNLVRRPPNAPLGLPALAY